MGHYLIVYGSEEGQTAKIAHHMTDLLTRQGHVVDKIYGRAFPAKFSMTGYDGIVFGASIHLGHHQDYMIELAKRYKDALAVNLSAFFTVCLTAKSNRPEDKAEVEQYVQNFIEATGWQPDQIGVFAGALLYTKYGLVKRYLMRSISKRAGGDVDTSHDYEYTDWDSVDEFVEMFVNATVGETILAPV